MPLAPGTGWARRTESVPQEPDSESSDLLLRREDVSLGWKGLELESSPPGDAQVAPNPRLGFQAWATVPGG